MKNHKIVAATGHRPDKLGGYSKENLERLIDFAIEHIPKDTTKVISGMALGWDMAIAYASIELKIPFTAAVPFKGQEKMWPSSSQAEFNYLIRNASEVVVVSDGGYASWKMQVRNQWMVNHCDLLLALWNGSSGGTGNCIAYATKSDKSIINLWSKFETT